MSGCFSSNPKAKLDSISVSTHILLETAMAFARGEFDTRVDLETLRNTSQLYELGLALNMLGEELGATTVGKLYVESIVNSMADMMVVLDPQGVIRSINPTGCDLLGYSASELAGQPLSLILYKEEVDQSQSILSEMVAGGKRESHDLSFRAKDGSDIVVQVRTSVLFDADKKVSDVILLARDMRETLHLLAEIAEAKAAEEQSQQLLHAYEELKEAHLQLIQAGKMAVLGEMAAGVAHELNQPLNGIKIIVQSIMRQMSRDKYPLESFSKDGRQIIDLINQMANIIEHMRVFTRMPDQEQKVDVDINRSIQNALQLLSRQLEVHDIDVQMDLTPDLPLVIGEPNGLQQILLNLLTNAKDAILERRMREKVLPGWIAIHSNSLTEGQVTIDVSDNGGGIDEASLDKIFSTFYTTKASGKGTGLGLSISKRIAASYQGRIEVETKKGEGTLFRIILPVPS